MRTVGIIPARGGSKGIPRKNVADLCGKPLIAYSISAALDSSLERTVVSTEDSEIATIALSLGAEVVNRPAELARDDTPSLPVLQHAVGELGAAFDVVVTLQPTSPLRTAMHIDEAMSLFNADPEADSLVSVVDVPHNMGPNSVMQIEGHYLRPYLEQDVEILRRQDKPTLYARNGAAIYITRASRLDQYVFGGNIIPYRMSVLESIDIDTEDDLYLASLVISDSSARPS